MRPLLTPGTHLLRRTDGTAQLGLDPARAIVLAAADQPESFAPRLGSPALAASPLLDVLRDRGLAAADDRALRTALPGTEQDRHWQGHTLAALFRTDPDHLGARLDRRARHTVRVHSFGEGLGPRLAADLLQVLERTGIAASTGAGPARQPPGALAATTSTRLQVLVGVGEPSRDVVDPWVREAFPHLLVRFVEGHPVIGPFVVPGATACLRCLDAHAAEQDASWPVLVEQYARATRTDRADGIPEPVDAALAAVAVAWAARDLASYAEGETPSSLSTTIRLDPRLESVETREWPRHPGCGCGWA